MPDIDVWWSRYREQPLKFTANLLSASYKVRVASSWILSRWHGNCAITQLYVWSLYPHPFVALKQNPVPSFLHCCKRGQRISAFFSCVRQWQCAMSWSEWFLLQMHFLCPSIFSDPNFSTKFIRYLRPEVSAINNFWEITNQMLCAALCYYILCNLMQSLV